MELITIEFEKFEDAAKRLPKPDAAYAIGSDEPDGCGNSMDVVVVYKEAA